MCYQCPYDIVIIIKCKLIWSVDKISVVLVTYFHISYSYSKVSLLVGVLVLVLVKLLKLNTN